MTVAATPSFFSSLSEDEREKVLSTLAARHFPPGAVLLAEGERPREMYVVTSGVCEVFVRDRQGSDVQIGQVGPGATIGEVALFAGQDEGVTVAPATLRALTAVDVVTLDASGFYSLAASFPQLLHNVGAILSQRLTRSYRHAVAAQHGRVTVLRDLGAPTLLPYALAASVAWHTRAATVLAVIGEPEADLASLARASRGGAAVQVLPADGRYPLAEAAGDIEELTHHYEHVIVLLPRDDPAERIPSSWLDARALRLTGPEGARPLPDAMPEGSAPGGSGRPVSTLRAWATPAQGRARPDSNGTIDVPQLVAADEEALRRGVLPSATPAGRALGWVARDLCGLKVGLALGAGSARGYAHYGVLQVLERLGLEADFVTGTSIGGIIASTYALGQTSDEAARTMEETSARAFRLTVPVHSLLSNAGVAGNFKQVAGDARIEDLPVPLALVAANLATGQEVLLRRGLLRVAALASMAIPGIYPPVRIGDAVLVDGGIVNPVPISVAASMGADVVVAVSLTGSAREPMPDLEAVNPGGRLPTLLHTLARSIEIMQGRIGTSGSAAATILIEPDFASIPTVGLQSFAEGRPYIAPGAAAAEVVLPQLAARLPWLRPGGS